MLDVSFNFMMMLLRHNDYENETLEIQGFGGKNILILLLDQMQYIYEDLYAVSLT